MGESATFPEQRFLCALFPDQCPQQSLSPLLQPDAAEAMEELRQKIVAVLKRLSYRERGILEMRYGLGDGHAYTLAESGYVFRLTRERIRQLQARSLKRLRTLATDLQHFVASLDLRQGGASESGFS